jgi:hypothetical protein
MEIEQDNCQICFDQEDPEYLLKFDCKSCIWCDSCTREWLAKQPKKGQLLKANFSCCNCRVWIRDTTGKIPRNEVDKIQNIFKHLSGLLIESRGEQEIISKTEVASDFLDTYDFVICSSCENPYFGGLHACNEVKFNESLSHSRLCPSCLPNNHVATCEIHGPHFVTHKCYYCCTVAKSFQNGKHLCEGCSYAAEKAEVKDCRSLTEQLHPKWACDGKHGPNGQNYSYGCLLCTQTCSSTPCLDRERNLTL